MPSQPVVDASQAAPKAGDQAPVEAVASQPAQLQPTGPVETGPSRPAGTEPVDSVRSKTDVEGPPAGPTVAEKRPEAPSENLAAETKRSVESQSEPVKAPSETQIAEDKSSPPSEDWDWEADFFEEWVRELADAEPEKQIAAEAEPMARPEVATTAPTISDALVHADQSAAGSPKTAAESESPRGAAPDQGYAKSDEAGASRALIDFESRPITSLKANIGQKAGEMPKNFGKEQLARMQARPADAVFARNWPMVCFQWEAPSLAYRPLYFEEVNLERYGYGMKYVRAAQPLISAGQFFTTVPILPYKLFAEPARTPVYTLGHYRPGSDVPFRPVYPPLSVSGGVVEAGVAAGLIFVVP
jgi:hypothetical protein